MKKKVNKEKIKKKVHVHEFALLICQTVNNIQWQIWGSPLGPHHGGQENIFRPGLLLGAAPCTASPQALSVNAFWRRRQDKRRTIGHMRKRGLKALGKAFSVSLRGRATWKKQIRNTVESLLRLVSRS